MATEGATYIDDLTPATPAGATTPAEGDDELRQLKSVLQNTFPNVAGAVTPTHTELNYVDGVTSAIQTQLDALASVAQNTQNATYTLELTDANKHIYKSNTSAYTWTIPANASKAFPIGSTVTFINAGSSGAVTLARDTDVALILAGDGTDSNKTLAAHGVATAIKVATNTWYISGAGVS